VANRLHKWERRLKSVIDKLDCYLEDKYGKELPLHPVRQLRGRTSNSAADGLFNITAKYTLGIGSKHGEGYGLDLRLATLSSVDPEFKQKIYLESKDFLNDAFEEYFPVHKLTVREEKGFLKICGDLSL
jgi:hypothetical protein